MNAEAVKERIERGKKARRKMIEALEKAGKKVPRRLRDRAERDAKEDNEWGRVTAPLGK